MPTVESDTKYVEMQLNFALSTAAPIPNKEAAAPAAGVPCRLKLEID